MVRELEVVKGQEVQGTSKTEGVKEMGLQKEKSRVVRIKENKEGTQRNQLLKGKSIPNMKQELDSVLVALKKYQSFYENLLDIETKIAIEQEIIEDLESELKVKAGYVIGYCDETPIMIMSEGYYNGKHEDYEDEDYENFTFVVTEQGCNKNKINNLDEGIEELIIKTKENCYWLANAYDLGEVDFSSIDDKVFAQLLRSLLEERKIVELIIYNTLVIDGYIEAKTYNDKIYKTHISEYKKYGDTSIRYEVSRLMEVAATLTVIQERCNQKEKLHLFIVGILEPDVSDKTLMKSIFLMGYIATELLSNLIVVLNKVITR